MAVLLDLFSRRVVGWATSEKNDTALAVLAFERAVAVRQPCLGLVHHTDRGSPYASIDYRAALGRRGVIPSMSRTGDCWDNAVAESFFSTLKTECTSRRWLPSRSIADAAVADYIDRFYNPTRRHSTLDYVSPIAFELRARLTAFAA